MLCKYISKGEEWRHEPCNEYLYEEVWLASFRQEYPWFVLWVAPSEDTINTIIIQQNLLVFK